ncbi:hypothetical protein [Bacillus sp. P14.5]|uniref:hypothetical protein n=1 Tax=Bacillus sp. P14.5 TaxID=1983400 RepID=UPI000DEB3184|nr:hypothetical protein [Bacillus sp. P14.5]
METKKVLKKDSRKLLETQGNQKSANEGFKKAPRDLRNQKSKKRRSQGSSKRPKETKNVLKKVSRKP